ncbi:DUF2510 domain-containing protein [Curtobacterium flaccumfaciens]|uniref:DUF2510 domain-containing protein n=3 Tax=Curtobacterium flaccumfaciens TaxID=2035 RepID=UPI0027E024A8|nr:DUF2510 domain-containing protein [Curtobacterium flaccumfaciens]
MANRVETGCRDCKKCTNSAAANLGRNSVRASTAVMTVGISELAMGFTKTCRGCGHKMSLHLGAQATTPQPTVTVQQPTPVPAPSQGPPPGWYADAQGANRWWDGLQWTEHVQHSMPPAPPAASSF